MLQNLHIWQKFCTFVTDKRYNVKFLKTKIMKYSIYCKSTLNEKEAMFWCKTIYQKWDEEDIPFKRRAKRIFKKYEQDNAKPYRTFHLIEEE